MFFFKYYFLISLFNKYYLFCQSKISNSDELNIDQIIHNNIINSFCYNKPIMQNINQVFRAMHI